jgi:hypothetical protein
MIQAAQGMLQAARALEKHESNFRAVQARQETQIPKLKEELHRMVEEVAQSKQDESRYAKLEKAMEDLRSSSRAETDESLLRQVEKRLDDNKQLYEESYKNIQDMLNGIRTKDGGQSQFELEMVRKRVESIEQMFKNVSAFEMLKLIQGGSATA